MSDIAIRVENLSKQYKIGVAKYRHDSIREHLTEWAKSLFARNGHHTVHGAKSEVQSAHSSAERLAPSALQSASDEYIWALKDVFFEVKHGEVIGIIGRNGSGKSTLLKILSRITEPTMGFAEIHGRVGSLLEVGTGFQRDLTGRENIYLNGAILGMKKAEIDRKFDEIVDFSGIEKFLDTPVKRYSSGMYVRLAFAVAAHLETEILLVDEVLAVGDAAFQTKCLGKIGSVAQEGRTVLFVSHNLAVVENLCHKGFMLRDGELAFCGGAKETTDHYFQGISIAEKQPFASPVIDLSNAPRRSASCRPMLKRLELYTGDGNPLNGGLKIGAAFRVALHFHLNDPCSNLDAGLGFETLQGQRIFTAHTFFEPDRKKEDLVGDQIFICEIPSLPLVPGQYKIKVWIDIDDLPVDSVDDATRITVVESDCYGSGRIPSTGVLVLKHHWRLQ